MPGIYLHIPFCKQACHYCDFHFSTTLKNKDELLVALKVEISLRRSYLFDKPLETIYFGGGTPSLLAGQEIKSLLEEIEENFVIYDPDNPPYETLHLCQYLLELHDLEEDSKRY